MSYVVTTRRGPEAPRRRPVATLAGARRTAEGLIRKARRNHWTRCAVSVQGPDLHYTWTPVLGWTEVVD